MTPLPRTLAGQHEAGIGVCEGIGTGGQGGREGRGRQVGGRAEAGVEVKEADGRGQGGGRRRGGRRRGGRVQGRAGGGSAPHSSRAAWLGAAVRSASALGPRLRGCCRLPAASPAAG